MESKRLPQSLIQHHTALDEIAKHLEQPISMAALVEFYLYVLNYTSTTILYLRYLKKNFVNKNEIDCFPSLTKQDYWLTLATNSRKPSVPVISRRDNANSES